MRAAERSQARLILVIAAAALALMMIASDDAVAKKKKLPYKTGIYRGESSQAAHNSLMLEVTKKQVNVIFFEFYRPSCVYPCMQPQIAGHIADIKKKKKKGTFRVDFYGYWVEGTLKGKEAEGTACDCYAAEGDLPALPVTWTATRTSGGSQGP